MKDGRAGIGEVVSGEADEDCGEGAGAGLEGCLLRAGSIIIVW